MPSGTASRTSGITLGSAAVTDSSVVAADAGRAVTGTGVPAGAVVGNVVVSTGYNLFVNGALANATVTNASAALTLHGILLFHVVDGITYQNALAQLAAISGTTLPYPQFFQAGDVNAPLPLLLVFPSATHIWLGGSVVTSSSTNVGADIDGVVSLGYDVVANDNLFAVATGSTATVQLLALRQ